MQPGIVTGALPRTCGFGGSRRALEYALSLRCLPGRVWEVILGHCTFLQLQERGTFSTFFTIYPFIRKNYYNSEPLWNSAREELFSVFGLVYFLQSSWRLPWSRVVTATDASLSGRAVASTQGCTARANVAASSETLEPRL